MIGAMISTAEMRHAHFQKLFFAERARREAIRSSVSIPIAAISFAVFAVSTLATSFDASRLDQPSSAGLALLACGSIATLFAAAYHVIMVEWLFVHHEPPSLAELVRAERQLEDSDGLSGRARGRLALACRRLTDAELAAKALLDLPVTPRLLLIGEEMAVTVTPTLRDEIVAASAAGGAPAAPG